jgi:hypothetical protein
MANISGLQPGKTYTAAELIERGLSGVVGSYTNGTFTLNSQGGWSLASSGAAAAAPTSKKSSSGGGSKPKAAATKPTAAKPTASAPTAPAPSSGGSGGGSSAGFGGSVVSPSMQGLTDASGSMTSGGDDGGYVAPGGVLAGPSKFRQGIGQRIPPQYSASLAALKQVY